MLIANIAPEEQAAIERRQLVMNLFEKGHVDRTVSLLLHLVARSSCAQVPGFIRTDVNEWRWKLLRDLCEPILDQRQRTGLSWRKHVTAWSLRHVLIELVLQHMMQMAEGLLLRHDGDVILMGISDQLRRLSRRESTAWRRRQRMIRIKQRVFKIRRVDVHLERGEDPNLVLLELECRKRAAGKIVVDAPIPHCRPVPHGSRRKHARRAGQWQ